MTEWLYRDNDWGWLDRPEECCYEPWALLDAGTLLICPRVLELDPYRHLPIAEVISEFYPSACNECGFMTWVSASSGYEPLCIRCTFAQWRGVRRRPRNLCIERLHNGPSSRRR